MQLACYICLFITFDGNERVEISNVHATNMRLNAFDMQHMAVGKTCTKMRYSTVHRVDTLCVYELLWINDYNYHT